jgi:hypothetical protein
MSRRRGRPPKPASERVEARCVKLSPQELDAVCRIAVRRQCYVHKVLRDAVRHYLESHAARQDTQS